MTKSLFCIFTIYNTVVIIHIHAEFYRSIWFSVAQEAHGLRMIPYLKCFPPMYAYTKTM